MGEGWKTRDLRGSDGWWRRAVGGLPLWLCGVSLKAQTVTGSQIRHENPLEPMTTKVQNSTPVWLESEE